MDNLNNSSNELEANFQNQEILKELISNNPSQSIDQNHNSLLRLELGRFVAAYYLNYSFNLFFKNIKELEIKEDNICLLPNLIIWSELEEQWLENSKKEEKEQQQNNLFLNNHWQLGQIFSEFYSPKLAIYLLLRENKILEAIFFVDNFNDLKAALILRFLAEKIYNINLLWEFCEDLLINKFLEKILFFEDYNDFAQITNNDQEYIKNIQKHLEAAFNIDILFSNHFNNNSIRFFDSLISKCAYYMGAEFENYLNNIYFDNEFSLFNSNYIKEFSSLLPRPPLFSIQLEEDNFNLFNKNNLEKFQELKCWLRLNRCYLIINIAFGMNNRLENLIGFFVLWLAKNQENNDLGNELFDYSIILENNLFIDYSEQEICLDLNIFQTLFSVIIGMQLYDLLIQNNNNNELIINKYKIKLNVISIPFKNNFNEEQQKINKILIWENIKKWIKLSEKEDLDFSILLLHTLQQQNQRYFKSNLLPLINKNRQKLFSNFLYKVEEEKNFNLNNKITEQLDILNNNKFKLNNFEDILIMKYLSKYFPFIPIPSKTIQINLNINPDDFCYFLPKENLNKNYEELNLNNSINYLVKEENKLINNTKNDEIDEIELLTNEIRLGIKRLELLGEEQKLKENNKEINKELIIEKNINLEKQYKNNNNYQNNIKKKNKKLRKFNRKNSITQSDLDKKQKTYTAFLSFLLKQNGIEESEELTIEPLKSISSINKIEENNSNNWVTDEEEVEEELEEDEFEEEDEEEEEENIINNKELTKEQILQEMNKIEKHLEWIWEQIGNRINEEEEEEEVKEVNKEFNNEEEKEEEIILNKIKESKENNEEQINNENIKEIEENINVENNEIKKQFKMPEIKIKSQINFSLPSLIEEEKSFELREEENEVKIKNNEWSIPPIIQPMDFSRLNIDSDEDNEQINNNKYKWTEIEVYPRDKEKRKEIKLVSKQQQKLNLKNKWKPPTWLRLLPPFDGTIKTERISSCNKIKTERQFLQLNLNKGRQRTFLDISTKNQENIKK
ncbi:hypothetical protein Mgra_00002748 [Meloidogyne graminicola]|uniref:Uncharacterized protein n=1 Tax=Meloidogyne graminicola TaxID=189291 RepID=A0A8S9ZX89_9BILA|nr:hypothetical protein Mgra_00002748 [Meloidogyne graminicola]